MTLARRTLALLLCATFAGGALAAPPEAPVKRLGKTVVQYRDARSTTVLSWKYANQEFGKDPWLLLEVAFAAEVSAIELDREDVSLLTPDGERLALPSQKRLAEGKRDVRWTLQRASVSTDPVVDYFPRATRVQRLPFFAVPSENTIRDTVSGVPNLLTYGYLFFEAPTGTWKAGRYTLVLKNKTMEAELPFTLPADGPKEEPKGADGKTVPW